MRALSSIGVAFLFFTAAARRSTRRRLP